MLAVGRIDLVTKSELVYQPLRALLIVGAALAFKSLMACALAYLVASVMYVPFAYAIKQRCISNDWEALSRNLLRSLAVTLATLAVPLAIALHAGVARTTPVSYGLLTLAALYSGAGWLVSLRVCRHPLAMDPLFLKLFDRGRHAGV
jgi:hypothetical protein